MRYYPTGTAKMLPLIMKFAMFVSLTPSHRMKQRANPLSHHTTMANGCLSSQARGTKNRLACITSLLAGIVLMMAGMGSSFAEIVIQADTMGLSKSSVFVVPTPKLYHYPATPAGESKLLPRAYQGAPPQVPHDIAGFLPITAQSNLCISCHALPAQWGQKREQGSPTPIPPSHYTDLRNAPSKVTGNLIGGRFNCNQCHVPQTNAVPLVKNTFSSRPAR